MNNARARADAAPRLDLLTYYRGRVALYAILKALGVGKGDEVVLQAFTCSAVPEAVLAIGAVPRFADIERLRLTMNPEDLDRKLGPRTKAVIVQHTFGIPADMPKLMRIADGAGVPIIEDCCHSFASELEGRRVGTWGAAAFYSFEWGKPIVAGLGGAATASSSELERTLIGDRIRLTGPGILKSLRLEVQFRAFTLLYRPSLYWRIRSAYRFFGRFGLAETNYHEVSEARSPEFDFEMDPRAQARLSAALGKMERAAEHARDLNRLYAQGIRCAIARHCSSAGTWAGVRYPLWTTRKASLLAAAEGERIEISGWYESVVHPYGEAGLRALGYSPGDCPEAEEAARCVVHLPANERTSRREAGRIISFLNSVKGDDA